LTNPVGLAAGFDKKPWPPRRLASILASALPSWATVTMACPTGKPRGPRLLPAGGGARRLKPDWASTTTAPKAVKRTLERQDPEPAGASAGGAGLNLGKSKEVHTSLELAADD